MLKLRKFLCGCFGFLAVTYGVVALSTVPTIFRFSDFYGFPLIDSSLNYPESALSIILLLLAKFVLAMPLVLAFLFGMAWWKTKQWKNTSKGWAIAASIGLILQSVPLLAPIVFIWTENTRGSGIHEFETTMLLFSGISVALGIAGLIAFTRSDANTHINPTKPIRIAGDGTSRLVDVIAWVLGFGGFLAGMKWYESWSYAHQLPISSWFLSTIMIVVALLISTVIHECGHASVGLALGMKLRMFIVGPFQWYLLDGKWKFQFHPAKLFCAGGAAGIVPANPNQRLWREICMIAAGPIASLLSGLIALAVMLTAKGKPYEQYWELFALVATISLVAFAVNRLPFRPESTYSDGARIYQLLRGGPVADFFKAFNLAGSITITPVRPRDYDIQAIQRASEVFSQGQQAVLLRFFAYNYFHDCGQIPEACRALDDAESIYHQTASDIPAEWHTLFIFGNAFLKRDAANARLWWERMQAKNPTDLNSGYWEAKSALDWIECNYKEANEAWDKGSALAQRCSNAGAYEFNRDCFSQLRHVLDASQTAEK